MEVVPLTDFQHGRISFRTGKSVNVPESLANDLERAHLVRVKVAAAPDRATTPPHTREAPARRTQEAPPARVQAEVDALGKALADGEGTPSASSQVARVSPAKTATPPKRGRGRPRSSGT